MIVRKVLNSAYLSIKTGRKCFHYITSILFPEKEDNNSVAIEIEFSDKYNVSWTFFFLSENC